jgi:hypothetical protein
MRDRIWRPSTAARFGGGDGRRISAEAWGEVVGREVRQAAPRVVVYPLLVWSFGKQATRGRVCRGRPGGDPFAISYWFRIFSAFLPVGMRKRWIFSHVSAIARTPLQITLKCIMLDFYLGFGVFSLAFRLAS